LTPGFCKLTFLLWTRRHFSALWLTSSTEPYWAKRAVQSTACLPIRILPSKSALSTDFHQVFCPVPLATALLERLSLKILWQRLIIGVSDSCLSYPCYKTFLCWQVKHCTMEFLYNGATCNLWLVCKRRFLQS